jgi:hypothetical protein
MRIRVALVGAVLAITLTSACGNDDTSKDSATTTSSTAATTSQPTTSVAQPTSYVDSGDYVNGRHIAFVTAIDTPKRTITVDVAQFLTGDAATKAYDEDEHTTGPPDNDYYVRNQSKQLRTFAVATSPAIHLQSLGSENGAVPSEPDKGRAVTFSDFAGYFSGDTAGAAKATLFWITLEGGVATRVEEQFVP